ncbi:SGNH/GDSL hydrolase family protein [Streptomyces sp. NPDC004262]
MARFRTYLALLGSATALATGVLAPAQSAGARAAATAEYRWVALGDSYTAGGIPATGDVYESPRDGCERTDQSYPRIIHRALGPLLDLTDVSCAAATVENVTSKAQQPNGRHLPPYSEDPNYPFPPVPAQAAAVGPGTDVITVGVGGNSLGFDIVGRCLLLGAGSKGAGTPCRDELAAGIPGRLARVADEYGRMLGALRARAPHARILAVGYPTVVPEDTSRCRYGDLRQFGSVTPGDLDWLRRDVLEPLDTVIEKSADGHRASFVDLSASSRKHSVCDTDQWVEGILDHDGRPALVHPNAEGQRNAAAHVASALLNAVGHG